MKKLIYLIGIICLIIVIVLNILFTAIMDNSEHITINNNTFFYSIGTILLGILIYVITNVIDKKYINLDNKKKKKILIIIMSIYAIANIVWIIVVRPPIVGDQIHACNLAQTFYNNNLEEFLPNLTYAGIPLKDYMQAHHQQISLAFVFSIFFRIIHFDLIEPLRVLNVIGSVAIVIALYKINEQLSKKYKTNKILLLTLILTFVSLPMLNTFIYGDTPSLALCLFSVYFMMKYTETKKLRYPITASIFTMIAYMMRMNCLIFIIATTIYLLLNLFKEITKVQWKENILKIVIIVMYIIIAIMPASIVKDYYLNKYGMDKNKQYPSSSYFLMAMEESWRGCGWYNEDIGNPALKDPDGKRQEYPEKIKARIKYFMENPNEAFDFYTKKLTSMWAENTYSAVRNNIVKENDAIQNITKPLEFYQKTLLMVTCICSLIALIQNRKNICIDVIFLLTIFIGGFSFHILWEAKSRYIIPYIVVLIPIASLSINETIKIIKNTFIKFFGKKLPKQIENKEI